MASHAQMFLLRTSTVLQIGWHFFFESFSVTFIFVSLYFYTEHRCTEHCSAKLWSALNRTTIEVKEKKEKKQSEEDSCAVCTERHYFRTKLILWKRQVAIFFSFISRALTKIKDSLIFKCTTELIARYDFRIERAQKQKASIKANKKIKNGILLSCQPCCLREV